MFILDQSRKNIYNINVAQKIWEVFDGKYHVYIRYGDEDVLLGDYDDSKIEYILFEIDMCLSKYYDNGRTDNNNHIIRM